MLFFAVTYWEPADRRCGSTFTTDTVDSFRPLGLREISCTRLAFRDRDRGGLEQEVTNLQRVGVREECNEAVIGD